MKRLLSPTGVSRTNTYAGLPERLVLTDQYLAGSPWLAWSCVAVLSMLVLVPTFAPELDILQRLGIHSGLRRGTIGYVRLLNVRWPILTSLSCCMRPACSPACKTLPSQHCTDSETTLQGHQCSLQDAGPLLPPELHSTVAAEDMLPGRLIVIGDVHGCLDELHELLAKVEYSQGNDTLVLAGDLVDKGPFSVEVRPQPTAADCIGLGGEDSGGGCL